MTAAASAGQAVTIICATIGMLALMRAPLLAFIRWSRRWQSKHETARTYAKRERTGQTVFPRMVK